MTIREHRHYRFRPPMGNQSGMALVTVLMFAAVLMAMMTMMLNTTMVETLLSGASTVSKRTLAAADAGIEYVRGTFVYMGSTGFPASSSTGNLTTEGRAELPGPLNQRVTFLNLTGMGVDPNLLVGSGFSSRYVAATSGGGALKLQPYRSRIVARAESGISRKTLEFEGYSLAP